MKKTVSNWPKFHASTWYREQLGPCPASAPPRGRVSTGTVVVGAGLAGLATAISLAERGVTDIVILERGEAGEGASGRNGGFVFAGFSLHPERLASQRGAEAARRMHRWTRESVGLVAERCRQLGVETSGQGVLLADWFGDDEALADYRSRMRDLLDFDLEWVARDRMADWVRSARYGSGLLEPGSFHFNPRACAQAMAGRLLEMGVRLHTGTPAAAIEPAGGRWRVSAPEAEFVAD